MRTNMMEEERTTERASESASRGSSRARADIESVTAVEEASPPTSPVSPSPRWGPRNRMAAYPRKLIPAIRTTSVPICRGLSASKGPNARSGRSGRTTTDRMRNFSVATTSWRERRRTSGFSAGFAESSAVATTATPATARNLYSRGRITSRVRDSAPRRKLTRKAASEVSPRSAPRRTSSKKFTTRKRMSEAKAATTTGHPVSRDTSTERPATSATSGCVRAPPRKDPSAESRGADISRSIPISRPDAMARPSET